MRKIISHLYSVGYSTIKPLVDRESRITLHMLKRHSLSALKVSFSYATEQYVAIYAYIVYSNAVPSKKINILSSTVLTTKKDAMGSFDP